MIKDIKLTAETKTELVAKVNALRESTAKDMIFFGGTPSCCKVLGKVTRWAAYVSIRTQAEHDTMQYQFNEYQKLSYKGD